MKKLIALLACCVMAFGLVGCGEDDPYANTTVLNIPYVASGFGTDGTEDFKNYLEEKYKDHSFAEGKKGLHIELLSESVQVSAKKNDGYDIYNVNNIPNNIDSYVGTGLVINLDEIISEPYDPVEVNGEIKMLSIKDKIEMNSPLIAAKSQLWVNGVSQGYYSVPATEFYPGITFDVQTFKRYGLYLADPEDEGAIEHESTLIGKSFYFIDSNGKDNFNSDVVKSAGPNGISGDEDDGLPATIEEFIALCEYCVDVQGVKALNVSGKHADYKNFIMEGIYTALLGPQQAETQYAFDGGDFEIVIGFEDEPLFPGLDAEGVDESLKEIKKPITKTIKLNENNGYYVTWSAAKYYAMALAEILYRNDYFFGNATNTNADQRTVMYDLIFSGYTSRSAKDKQVAMLIESSFWYTEADVAGYHQEFQEQFPDQRITRQYQFMALPVALDDSQASADYLEKYNEDRVNTLVDHFSSATYISETCDKEENPEKYAAAKVYLQEKYSNERLNVSHARSGCKTSVYYTLEADTVSQLPDYFQRLTKLTEKSEVVYYASTSPVFNALDDYILVGYQDELFGWRTNGFLHQVHINSGSVNAVKFFQKADKMLTKEDYKKRVNITENAADHPYTFAYTTK